MAKNLSKLSKDLQKSIASSVEVWIKDNTAAKVREKVFTHLDRALDRVIMLHLGFSDRYGHRWEVDSNRLDSEINKKIRELVGPAVDEWLEKAFEKATVPNTGSIQKLIMEEFRKVFQEEVRRRVRDAAQAKAEDLVSGLTQDLTIAKLSVLAEEDDDKQIETDINDDFFKPKAWITRR